MIIAYGATSLTVEPLYPVERSFQAFQSVGVSTDGKYKVRNSTARHTVYHIRFRANLTLAASFLALLVTSTLGGCYAATITPESNQDLGAGLGTAVTAYYWGEGISRRMIAWHVYEFDTYWVRKVT